MQSYIEHFSFSKLFKKSVVDFMASSAWKDYSDRTKKAAASEILICILQEVDPEGNDDSVVKSNNIRTSNRKEHKSIGYSNKSGANDTTRVCSLVVDFVVSLAGSLLYAPGPELNYFA